MGYTRHWSVNRDEAAWPTVWAKTALDTATVILPWAERAGITLAGWDGTGDPEVTEGTICLNGRDPESCETFRLDAVRPEPYFPGHNPDRDFTKTRRLAYDAVVHLILLRLTAHAGAHGATVHIYSDGPHEDDAHREVYASLFGEVAP